MRRLVSLMFVAAVAVPASAQDLPRRVPSPDRSFTFSFGGPDNFVVARRGRLGVTVDIRQDPARDTVGALIAGVTPGGAAERAGVRTGDLVVRFNGTRLAGATPEEGDNDQSRPALRLIRFASRLDPGDTVRLDIRRDGRPSTITFQAEESDMDVMVRRIGPEGMNLPFGMDLPGGGSGRMMIMGTHGLSDLELVKVTPGLGDYFGTDEGLLVVATGADSSLGLRAGDVILSIGGRRPTSPSHAMRILSTYEARETVQFQIMRQRRRSTVSGRMPDRAGTVRWRVSPNSFELPLMPRLPADLFDDDVRPRIHIRRQDAPHTVIIRT